MSARVGTILIVGGTAGIGEQLAHRFHSLGKKVIVTGRNQDKLTAMAQELGGLEVRGFDIAELSTLKANVTGLLNDFPDIDTVILNAGIQKSFNLYDPSSITPGEIAREIETNLTAPVLLAHMFAPHLLARATKGTKTTLFITSSSLAYVPLGFYPSYSASKAGVHALALTLRQQLAFAPEEAKKNMQIVEIVPPYTDTGLDKEHRAATIAAQGGPEKAFPAMPLKDFVDQFFVALEATEPDGSIKNEIGVGFGQTGINTWRSSFGKIYEQWGMST
ncbi:hypothetical protein DE146DRAFT_623361 [Phaeosphaeria sp. MPI-PUGE-AT-0046c]|nr:hypothetical protein DE146DRAFT_623361 [Phaeosphaeria sp. MPI-PUGE-AT-0046c]